MRNHIFVKFMEPLNFKVVSFGRWFLHVVLSEFNMKQLHCLWGVFLAVWKPFRFCRLVFYDESVSGF